MVKCLIFSLNDPQWGQGSDSPRSPEELTPAQPSQPVRPQHRKPGRDSHASADLDKMWHDFNQRLSEILGKGRSNRSGRRGNSENGSGHGKSSAIIGLLLLLILVVFWLVTGFFTVHEGQIGVVTTFGKYARSTASGFKWRWPMPIQDHDIVDVSKVRTLEVGYRGNVRNKELKESLMLTEDENIIDIQFAVQYRLKDGPDWIFNNRDPDSTVRQVAETAIREVVGKNQMDFVLYEGREKIAIDVDHLMQQILDRYKIGVLVTSVTMQGVQPPEQVQAAFDDAVKAGQDRERQKNEGYSYANEVIPKARGAASRLLQESQGYSARVVAMAQGDASRFSQVVAEYQKAPIVTRERMYLETIQHIFSNTAKVMIESKSGNNLIVLPIDKLLSGSINTDSFDTKAEALSDLTISAVKGVESSILSTAPSAAASSSSNRTRHDRRSRDREAR